MDGQYRIHYVNDSLLKLQNWIRLRRYSLG